MKILGGIRSLRKGGGARKGRKCLPCKLKISNKGAYNQPVIITNYSQSFNKEQVTSSDREICLNCTTVNYRQVVV